MREEKSGFLDILHPAVVLRKLLTKAPPVDFYPVCDFRLSDIWATKCQLFVTYDLELLAIIYHLIEVSYRSIPSESITFLYGDKE